MFSCVAVAWHMAWCFSLVHVSLVAGIFAWALRYFFSLLGGAVPLWPAANALALDDFGTSVSWRFHGSDGPPSVSAAAKKVTCAGSRASCVAAMWQMAWVLSTPLLGSSHGDLV